MKTTAWSVTLAATVLAIAGCGSSENPGVDPATTQAGSPSPSSTVAPDTGSPEPTEVSSQSPTDLPAETMLPATALRPADGPRDESEGVVEWRLPASCGADVPADAAAMRTVSQGDGQMEAPIGVQQVAVFADADVAAAEADRLASAMTGCTPAAADSPTLYLVEEIAVGAQGHGLVTDYYGVSAGDSGDASLGAYLAITRRGNAVTLVSAEGGENSIGSAREEVVGATQEAWELLCRYDSAGC